MFLSLMGKTQPRKRESFSCFWKLWLRLMMIAEFQSVNFKVSQRYSTSALEVLWYRQTFWAVIWASETRDSLPRGHFIDWCNPNNLPVLLSNYCLFFKVTPTDSVEPHEWLSAIFTPSHEILWTLGKRSAFVCRRCAQSMEHFERSTKPLDMVNPVVQASVYVMSRIYDAPKRSWSCD